MEESQPSEKLEQEKNSPTATSSKKKMSKDGNHLKVLNFFSKDALQSVQDKTDLLELLMLVATEVESGRDLEVSKANCGIVILGNADGETLDSSAITIYTTQSSPIKMVGLLEFVKNQIIEQS